MKKQIPKWMLVVGGIVIAIVLAIVVVSIFGGRIKWPNSDLGNAIPRIERAKGEFYEFDSSLSIDLEKIDRNEYNEYVSRCKSMGYTVDAVEKSNSYFAYNAKGYKLDIHYWSDGDMDINVDAPIEMSAFSWPGSDIAKLIPKTKSNYGKILWEAEYGFVIYVGNTSKADYDEYVSSVYDLGFSVDYNKGDDYFNADNADGYSLSLKYEGFNTMFVRIDEPDEDISDETVPDDDDLNEGGPDEGDSETNSGGSGESDPNDSEDEDNNSGSNSGEMVDGMRVEFKEAMDSYEAFFDEYCEFMKKYNSSGNPVSMLNDYMSFLSRYTEAMTDLNEIRDGELNNIEVLYFVEVMARINQKLLEIN